jgi:putative ABC transport system substrate-binding protein
LGSLPRGTPATHGRWVNAFVQRLNELGWVDGRTITIKYRWAEGRSDRYAQIAAEVVRLDVDVIVTQGGAVAAAKKATSVIAIVFTAAADPLACFIHERAHPGS